MTTADSLTTPLQSRIVQAIDKAQGWLGFDDFMHQALYTPGLGYYANDLRKLGLMPGSGSDFVTAPELSPLFGRALMPQMLVSNTALLRELHERLRGMVEELHASVRESKVELTPQAALSLGYALGHVSAARQQVARDIDDAEAKAKG